MKSTAFQDCFAKWDENALEFGNAEFSRRIEFSEKTFYTTALTDGKGITLTVDNAVRPDCVLYDTFADIPEARNWKLDTVMARIRKGLPFEGDHLEVSFAMTEQNSLTRLVREFFIYPGLAMFGLRNRITLKVLPSGFVNARAGLRRDYQRDNGSFDLPVVDTLHPADGFEVKRCVEFSGHSDVQDKPVREHDIDGETGFTGNLLLNVGPDRTGKIPEGAVDALKKLTAWNQCNGEAVTGCGQSDYQAPFGTCYTQKSNVIYCYLLTAPLGDLILPGLRDKVEKITLLRTGQEVNIVPLWGYELLKKDNLRIRPQPSQAGDVLKIELKK